MHCLDQTWKTTEDFNQMYRTQCFNLRIKLWIYKCTVTSCPCAVHQNQILKFWATRTPLICGMLPWSKSSSSCKLGLLTILPLSSHVKWRPVTWNWNVMWRPSDQHCRLQSLYLQFQPRLSTALCMAWLDKQAPCFVLLASYGTAANLDTTELEELGHGCATLDNLSFRCWGPTRKISCQKNSMTNATWKA